MLIYFLTLHKTFTMSNLIYIRYWAYTPRNLPFIIEGKREQTQTSICLIFHTPFSNETHHQFEA